MKGWFILQKRKESNFSSITFFHLAPTTKESGKMGCLKALEESSMMMALYMKGALITE